MKVTILLVLFISGALSLATSASALVSLADSLNGGINEDVLSIGDDLPGPPYNNNMWAIQFTSADTAFVSSVDLACGYDVDTGDAQFIRVGIFTDVGDTVGILLESVDLELQNDFRDKTMNNFPFSGSTYLSAGQKYWIAASPVTPQSRLRWNTTDNAGLIARGQGLGFGGSFPEYFDHEYWPLQGAYQVWGIQGGTKLASSIEGYSILDFAASTIGGHVSTDPGAIAPANYMTASRFTSAHTAKLKSVDLPIAYLDPCAQGYLGTQVSVGIFTNDPNANNNFMTAPEDLLESAILDVQVADPSTAMTKVNFSGTTTLIGGKPYWIGVSVMAPESHLVWFLSSKPDDFVVSGTGVNFLPPFEDDDLEISSPNAFEVWGNNFPVPKFTFPWEITYTGDVIVLDGTESSDPDGDPLTYEWQLLITPEGSDAFILDPNSPTTSFTPDVEGMYKVELTVTDPYGDDSTEVAAILVTNVEEFAEIKIIEASDLIRTLKRNQVTSIGHKRLLQINMQIAVLLIQLDRPKIAIRVLKRILRRVDGCTLRGGPDPRRMGRNRDWVTDCDAQKELYQLINEAIDALRR